MEQTQDHTESDEIDHRVIGRNQELFFFHELSPGSCFFLPKGAHIYNKLIEFMKQQYPKWGFTEVVSPNIYNKKLWEISGHWQHYQQNMFSFDVEGDKYGIKPMNCPGHCLMYSMRPRSYRELPLRLAEFGICHRNELSGTLNGLTRVRRFMQDDAHIFLRPDQIENELIRCLQFMDQVYKVFQLEYTLGLSTRPVGYIGNIDVWNTAENQLKKALDQFAHPYIINEGDGAFYGPKIDIKIQDAMHRPIQCATIQLDFNLPDRFNLLFTKSASSEVAQTQQTQSEYNHDEHPCGINPNPNAFEHPIMIHRAILGSLERFIAVITEKYNGKFPFWLSPNQIIILPINDNVKPYCDGIYNKLHDLGYQIDIDESSNKLGKKMYNARMAKYNFMIVIGDREMQTNMIAIKNRDPCDLIKSDVMSIDELILIFDKLKTNFV